MEVDDEESPRGTKRASPDTPSEEPGAYVTVATSEHSHRWKRLRETTTGEAIPSLPFEILVAILRFLDIRTAMREFRTVSRAFSEAVLESQRLFREQSVIQTDAIAVSRPLGQHAFAFARADETVLACERFPEPVSRVQRFLLLRAPYDESGRILAFGFPWPAPTIEGHYAVCYLSDELYLLSSAENFRLLALRKHEDNSFTYDVLRLEDHYGTRVLRSPDPSLLALLSEEREMPRELVDLPIASLLQRTYVVDPVPLPGVGSVLVFPRATVLVTPEAAFWLGPGSPSFLEELMRPEHLRPQTAGWGLIAFVSSWHHRRVGATAKFARRAVIARYSEPGRTARLRHVLTIHYPSPVTEISVTSLAERYLLVAPVMEDAPRPALEGKIYLYDMAGTGDAIHVFRLPAPVSHLPLTFLHAAGSTLVAFYRADFHIRLLRWAALYSLINPDVFTVDNIQMHMVGTISMASRGFVFTSGLGAIFWYRVTIPGRPTPPPPHGTESGEETQMEEEEGEYEIIET